MKHLTLLILLALAPLSWGEEPAMKTPFKCISDYRGGVFHEQDLQGPAEFTNELEFRLVPRVRLPASILEMVEIFPVRILKDRGQLEYNTYWLRRVDRDPLIRSSWRACNVITSDALIDQKIVCGDEIGFPTSLFRLNLETKKFVQAYLGSWDVPNSIEGFYGDDSVFSFGICRPYFD